ncbi:MAG TPA: hypothetical protein VE377_25800 [Candidatus Dormibacteraeota bacterium]|nr:hypothetical protein [Candidatus Dormibacteraeota bacterium]
MSANRRESRDKYLQLEAQALAEAEKATTLEERGKSAETLKNLAEARNSAISTRFQRWRDLSSSAVPILALVVTALTVILQTRQFHQTLTQQGNQFVETERQQAMAHEDTEWREALKAVSFTDRRSSLVGAFAMQGFFNSPRYGNQARGIAGGLLANTANVSSFDEILTNMRDKTDASNLTHMTALAQMLGFAQRAKYHTQGASSDATAPFLIPDVDEIDPNPQDFEHNPTQQIKVAAWEIDTVSQFLRQLWRDPKKNLSPQGYVLTATVLENGDFDNLDFSGSHLDFGILFNATFLNAHFDHATMKDLFVRHVNLEGVDFSGVTVVEGSRWEDTNWWRAKCVPGKMLDYLVQQTKHAVTPEDRTTLTQNCR